MPSQNDRAIYALARAGGYTPPPWARGGSGDYGDGTLGGLIGRQGALQAQRHAGGAEMLAQGFQQALSGVGDYFEGREQKKEMAKRDSATLAAIEGWDGQDPMALYKSMLQVRGPQDAMQYTNQVLSLRGGPKKDPAQELGRVGTSAQFFMKLPPEVQAASWPVFRQSLGPSLGNLGIQELPEQWDPQNLPVVKAIGSSFGPKEEKQKPFAVGGAVYDPESQQFIAPPEKAPEGKVVETVDERGRPITKMASGEELVKGVPKYVPPKEPREAQRTWVIRDGQATRVAEGDIRPGDKPYAAPQNQRLTKDERQHFASIEYSLPRIGKFEEYIRANPGKWGVWDAFREGVKQIVPGLPDAEYANKGAFLGRLNAEIKHALYGAALSEGERADAERFLIRENDQPEVALGKLKEVRERMGSDVNYYRGLGFNMPGSSGGQGGAEVPRVSTQADYAKLPSGATYIDPSGKRRRKR